MKGKPLILVIICVLLIGFLIYFAFNPTPQKYTSESNQLNLQTNNSTTTMQLTISSPSFENNGNIPAKYTCDGDSTIPPLTFAEIDPNAKSLVLIMDDPDAISVVGHTFDHWVKFNISPQTTSVSEGVEPQGIAGKNGAGELTYTGPCPPNGIHHYHFKLYSLDELLSLSEWATKSEVETAMKDHIIQQAELIGLYSRK